MRPSPVRIVKSKNVEGLFCEPCAKSVERGRCCAACSTVYSEADNNMIQCNDCSVCALSRAHPLAAG